MLSGPLHVHAHPALPCVHVCAEPDAAPPPARHVHQNTPLRRVGPGGTAAARLASQPANSGGAHPAGQRVRAVHPASGDRYRLPVRVYGGRGLHADGAALRVARGGPGRRLGHCYRLCRRRCPDRRPSYLHGGGVAAGCGDCRRHPLRHRRDFVAAPKAGRGGGQGPQGRGGGVDAAGALPGCRVRRRGRDRGGAAAATAAAAGRCRAVAARVNGRRRQWRRRRQGRTNFRPLGDGGAHRNRAAVTSDEELRRLPASLTRVACRAGGRRRRSDGNGRWQRLRAGMAGEIVVVARREPDLLLRWGKREISFIKRCGFPYICGRRGFSPERDGHLA
ncbi:unnamed protein product [Phaeothamnion confervicola]